MGLYEKYTVDDIDFINKNYKSMTYQQIAESLGRTKSAIRHKTNEYGYIFVREENYEKL